MNTEQTNREAFRIVGCLFLAGLFTVVCNSFHTVPKKTYAPGTTTFKLGDTDLARTTTKLWTGTKAVEVEGPPSLLDSVTRLGKTIDEHLELDRQRLNVQYQSKLNLNYEPIPKQVASLTPTMILHVDMSQPGRVKTLEVDLGNGDTFRVSADRLRALNAVGVFSPSMMTGVVEETDELVMMDYREGFTPADDKFYALLVKYNKPDTAEIWFRFDDEEFNTTWGDFKVRMRELFKPKK